MTDFASLVAPDRGEPARVIHLVDAPGLEGWLATQPPATRLLAEAGGFNAKPDQLLIVPEGGEGEWSAVLGVAALDALTPWCLAAAAERLPAGDYRLNRRGAPANRDRQPSSPAAPASEAGAPGPALLGWLLAQHRLDRYRSKPEEERGPRRLLVPDLAEAAEHVAEAEATALVRDLVNTPASDLGPAELAAAVELEARAHDAEFSVIEGEALGRDFPAVAAVGRGAAPHRGPRLVELRWGDPAHPTLALVGKGVCFDSGGLDIKPASAMLTMKKDMGGAAHALALARLVMRAELPVRLRLLIPAVENAVSGDAFRPGDILRTRKGLSVEIGNTDAEGRLILADALAAACEERPDLVLDFATLTGAARVALGPELPALFTDDEALAEAFLAAGRAVADPLWRLPLWQPYADMLKSELADINNVSEGSFAGAITAALFLRRFVEPGVPHAHLDLFAWRPAAKPGRPKGGEAMSLRAAWRLLRERYRPARD